MEGPTVVVIGGSVTPGHKACPVLSRPRRHMLPYKIPFFRLCTTAQDRRSNDNRLELPSPNPPKHNKREKMVNFAMQPGAVRCS